MHDLEECNSEKYFYVLFYNLYTWLSSTWSIPQELAIDCVYKTPFMKLEYAKPLAEKRNKHQWSTGSWVDSRQASVLWPLSYIEKGKAHTEARARIERAEQGMSFHNHLSIYTIHAFMLSCLFACMQSYIPRTIGDLASVRACVKLCTAIAFAFHIVVQSLQKAAVYSFPTDVHLPCGFLMPV